MVFAFRLRALVGLLLALERRRIAHPRLRTTPVFKQVLQQGFAISGMGFEHYSSRRRSIGWTAIRTGCHGVRRKIEPT
jgi:hypothetical protein